ncbi:MAG TPA: type II secretion system F family protein [Dehalococcoidia bacterium]|nr:type II secretion system F family protein [Dehalococcoidia bacterium]
MVPFLAALTGASSVLLIATWYAFSKGRADARLRTLMEPQRMVLEQADPFTQRVAFPVVDGLVNAFAAVLPTRLVTRANAWLVTAGDRTSLPQFLSIVLMLAAGFGAAAWAALALITGEPLRAITLVVALSAAAAGLLLPFVFLRVAAKSRQKQIWRALPSSLDLMTTCVEAGLSLDFALHRVSERYKGPFSDEITRALREMTLGKLRRDALMDMARRIDLPDVMTFVNSLLQAEALGTSVGAVLRVQAAQMRTKRRQRAEEQARKAPVKMVVPLVFALMPSLFIITLGPVMLNVIKVLHEN